MGHWIRLRIVLELIALYVGLPLVVLALGRPGLFLLIPALLLGSIYCWLRMRGERRSLFDESKPFRHAWRIMFRFSVCAGIFSLLFYLIKPNWFLWLPKNNPALWLLILIYYPVLSALPQEIIYRVYFMMRLRELWPEAPALLIGILNALLFGFAHIVLRNPWAPILTFFGGLLFVYTYLNTRSLFWVTLEHALWGNLIFTLGLGALFHGGTVANFL